MSGADFDVNIDEVFQARLANEQFFDAAHAGDVSSASWRTRANNFGVGLAVHQILQAAPKDSAAGQKNCAGHDQRGEVVDEVPVGAGPDADGQAEQHDQRTEHVEALIPGRCFDRFRAGFFATSME